MTTSWSEISKRGRKPYLDSKEVMELAYKIQKQCEGGMTISLSELKEEIILTIKKKYAMKGKLYLLKDIPENTLNAYASIIKSQGIFSLYSSISNKTESRAVAEWSLRSTISYLMAIA